MPSFLLSMSTAEDFESTSPATAKSCEDFAIGAIAQNRVTASLLRHGNGVGPYFQVLKALILITITFVIVVFMKLVAWLQAPSHKHATPDHLFPLGLELSCTACLVYGLLSFRQSRPFPTKFFQLSCKGFPRRASCYRRLLLCEQGKGSASFGYQTLLHCLSPADLCFKFGLASLLELGPLDLGPLDLGPRTTMSLELDGSFPPETMRWGKRCHGSVGGALLGQTVGTAHSQ